MEMLSACLPATSVSASLDLPLAAVIPPPVAEGVSFLASGKGTFTRKLSGSGRSEVLASLNKMWEISSCGPGVRLSSFQPEIRETHSDASES